jgi:hypothetical protein
MAALASVHTAQRTKLVEARLGGDPAEWESVGATWGMRALEPGEPLDMLLSWVESGPPR